MRFSDEIWVPLLLGDQCVMTGGGTPSTKNISYWSGNIPWISSADVSEDFFDIKITRRITEEAITQSATKMCPPNSILLVSRVGVGKIGIYEKPVCTSQDFTNIISYPFDKYFLAFYLQRILKRKANEAQGTSIKGITSKEIKSLKLYIPTKEAQFKIGNLLKLINTRIVTQNKIIRDLNSYKNSIIDSFFKKCTDFVSLDKILYERKKYSEKGANYEHVTLSKDGIVPKGERYDRDFLVKDASKEYKITKLNDICYNPANLKFGVICLNDYGDAIFSPIYVTFEVNQAFDPFYVSLYLTSNKFINYILKYQQGTVYERMAVGPNDFVKAKLPICNNISTFTNLIKVINNKIKIEMNLLEKYMLQKTYLSESLFI